MCVCVCVCARACVCVCMNLVNVSLNTTNTNDLFCANILGNIEFSGTNKAQGLSNIIAEIPSNLIQRMEWVAKNIKKICNNTI